DASGSSCQLSGVGFMTTPTVLHRFTLGATASRWYINAGFAPGTTILAFTTPYTTVGDIHNDLRVGYAQCLTGTIVLGTLVMVSGGIGHIDLIAAQGFANIIYTDCSSGEHPATGGNAYMNGSNNCGEIDAVEPSTWGQVKSLYR